MNKSLAGVKRKPKLGQNFLTDLGAARRIVEALGDVYNRTVIEIGPGRGVLTDVLVSRRQAGDRNRARSRDGSTVRMRYATRPNIEILESDFVTAEFTSMVGRQAGAAPRSAPYPAGDRGRNRQPSLLHHLRYCVADSGVHQNIERAVIMVQREVADRIAAGRAAGTTDCSPPPCNCLRASITCSRCRRVRSASAAGPLQCAAAHHGSPA